jgi:hypothetical protein
MPEGVQVVALLQDHSTSSISGGINFDSGRTGWASDSQNGFGSEGSFERLESGLLCRAPYKEHIILGEVMKRPADLGEIFDEASVEIGKPNETPDFFEFCRWGPIADGFHFDWVHGNFAGTDDQSKVVNMGLLELALLGTEVQIVFFEMSKDFVDDLPVFLESGTPNENVIQIGCNFSFGN